MTHCKNCGQTFTGKYCSNCGQKASVGELTMHELLHEAWHSLTHTDKGIFKVVKDLLVHPKTFYNNYFSGQRKKYFSPVTFFLVTAALLIFIGLKIFDYEDYLFKNNNEFGRYVFHETRFRTLILLVFEILVTWTVFHKQYNLAKQIVFWLFLNSLLFVVQIFSTPLDFIFIRHHKIIDNVVQVFQYILIFWHLIMVFGKKKWLNITFCFLLVNLLFMADYLLGAYLLFGSDLLLRTQTQSIFGLMLQAYVF